MKNYVSVNRARFASAVIRSNIKPHTLTNGQSGGWVKCNPTESKDLFRNNERLPPDPPASIRVQACREMRYTGRLETAGCNVSESHLFN
jgi:hypothetical protein